MWELVVGGECRVGVERVGLRWQGLWEGWFVGGSGHDW